MNKIKSTNKIIRQFHTKSYHDSSDYQKNYIYIIIPISLVLIMIGTMLYRGLPPTLSNFASFFINGINLTDAIELTEYRREITKAHYFGGEYTGQGLLRSILRIGWSYTLCLSFIIFYRTKSKSFFRKETVILTLVFILSFVYITGDGTRGPFVELLIHLAIAFSFMGTIRFRHVFLGVIILFSLLIFLSANSMKMYTFLGNEDFIISAINNIVERIVIGNSINDIRAINFISNGQLDFQFGRIHLVQLLNSIPGIQYDLPFSHTLGQLYGSGETTYLSTTYVSVVYADFTIIGVIITYFILGIIISKLQKYLYSMEKNSLNLSLIFYIFFRLAYIQNSGIIAALVTIIVLLLIHNSSVLLLKALIKLSNGNTMKDNRLHRKGEISC
ncbi:MAG: O-antigen polymerase [Acholeplasma sp.]|nr:O-antigen polymerase [Acholeplasma sp.]